MRCVLKVNKTPFKSTDTVNGVVHPVTQATITQYKPLIDDSSWEGCGPRQCAKKWGDCPRDMLRRDHSITLKVINTTRFLDHEEFGEIPRDRVVTYARVMVDYCAHTNDTHCGRTTTGGIYQRACTQVSLLHVHWYTWGLVHLHRCKQFIPCNPIETWNDTCT